MNTLTSVANFYAQTYKEMVLQDIGHISQTVDDLKRNCLQEVEHIGDWKNGRLKKGRPNPAIIGMISIITRVGGLLALAFASCCCAVTLVDKDSPRLGRFLLAIFLAAIAAPLHKLGNIGRQYPFGDQRFRFSQGSSSSQYSANSWAEDHARRRIGSHEYLEKLWSTTVRVFQEKQEGPVKREHHRYEVITYRSTLQPKNRRPVESGNSQVWKDGKLMTAEEIEEDPRVPSLTYCAKKLHYGPLPDKVSTARIRKTFAHLD